MKRVSLKLSKQIVAVKIEKGKHIVISMTGNPSFLTPVPALAAITTANLNLETAYNNALGGGKVLKAIMYEKEVILDNLLIQLGHYVEVIANGSESVILSAGMDVRATGSRTSRDFSLMNGTLPGDVKMKTKFYAGNSYIWQMVVDPFPSESMPVDPAHTWEQVGVSTKSTFVKSELVIGKRYWFRVANVSKDGQGAWSDPLSIVVI